MNKLTLSKRPENALPEHVVLNGERYLVRAGFRTILTINRLLSDTEVEDRHKGWKLIDLFYAQSPPPELAGDAIHAYFDFIRPPEREVDPDAGRMDYEHDADAIYASFRMQYHIDLLSPDTHMHWYAFSALLAGLGEGTPLVERLRMRTLDLSKLKGKSKRRASIAKRNAQIPVRIGTADKRQYQELADALMNGGDISAILGQE
jgi:hypothetical protein